MPPSCRWGRGVGTWENSPPTSGGPMTTRWSLTFDCHDAEGMARFWTVARGYRDCPPPEGWDTWEAWLEHFGVPEEEWGDGASLQDPQGVLPKISFLRVPEPKTAKNRLHIDLQVSGGR